MDYQLPYALILGGSSVLAGLALGKFIEWLELRRVRRSPEYRQAFIKSFKQTVEWLVEKYPDSYTVRTHQHAVYMLENSDMPTTEVVEWVTKTMQMQGPRV